MIKLVLTSMSYVIYGHVARRLSQEKWPAIPHLDDYMRCQDAHPPIDRG